jgi:CRISPR associated protein
MLFEAQIGAPHPSAYRQHEFLEAMFAHLEDEKEREFLKLQGQSPRRNFLWCEQDGQLIIRRQRPTNDLAWQPVLIPPADSMINFQLSARCRRPDGDLRDDLHPFFSRGARPPITDPNEVRDWLERRAPVIGLQIEDVEVEMFVRPIEKPSLSRFGAKPMFRMLVASFYGVATVSDPQRFERGLTLGIGDAKAFGLGLMLFWQRGQY